MKNELEEELIEKYPKIFSDIHEEKDMSETAMVWGFEHGNGWYFIIDSLCDTIKSLVENYNRQKLRKKRSEDVSEDTDIEDLPPLEDYELEESAEVRAKQVKEKFGGLRFYVTVSHSKLSEKVHSAIEMAQRMSYRVCEDCGTTENVTTNDFGWIRTLCDDCRED